MLGLYKDPIHRNEFIPPTMMETYLGILESHAKCRDDRDIDLGILNSVDVFNDFLQASKVLIKHSSDTVRMILNDMNFRKLVNRGTLDDSMKHFISEGGQVVIDILGQSTREIRQECIINLFDGSSKQLINTHRGFDGIQGDITIGDDDKSVYTILSGGGNINFGSRGLVESLEDFYPEGKI